MDAFEDDGNSRRKGKKVVGKVRTLVVAAALAITSGVGLVVAGVSAGTAVATPDNTETAVIEALCNAVGGSGAANYSVSVQPDIAYTVTFGYNNGYSRSDNRAAGQADVGALFGAYGDTSNPLFASTNSATSVTISVTDGDGQPPQNGSLTFDRTTCGQPPTPTPTLQVNSVTRTTCADNGTSDGFTVDATIGGESGASMYFEADLGPNALTWASNTFTATSNSQTLSPLFAATVPAGEQNTTLYLWKGSGVEDLSSTVVASTTITIPACSSPSPTPTLTCNKDSDGSTKAWYSNLTWVVDDKSYDNAQAALNAAKPGDKIVLTGDVDVPASCATQAFAALYLVPKNGNQILLDSDTVVSKEGQHFTLTVTLPVPPNDLVACGAKYTLQYDSGVGEVLPIVGTDQGKTYEYGNRKFDDGFGKVTFTAPPCETQSPTPTPTPTPTAAPTPTPTQTPTVTPSPSPLSTPPTHGPTATPTPATSPSPSVTPSYPVAAPTDGNALFRGTGLLIAGAIVLAIGALGLGCVPFARSRS